MKKILFVDVPFTNAQNQDSKRSQFIWDALCKKFDADLLLIKTPEYLTKPLINPDGYAEVFTLVTTTPGPFKTKEIYEFTQENKDKFIHILQRKHYEIVFFRLIRCAELIHLAEQALPESNLVIDADYLISTQAERLWLQNPTWKNALRKIEYLHLKKLENSLFRKAGQCYFSNNKEMALATKNAGNNQSTSNFMMLPNVLPKIESSALKQDISDAEKALLADKYILFYGNLETQENIDAFTYLAKEIYPRVSKKLQEKDIKIYIVGNNSQRVYEQYSGGRLKLIGSVANLYAYIKASLFVILPIKAVSGAMFRILETAMLKKAVLTTFMGAEGLDFNAEEIVLADKTDDICNRITEMIASPGKTTEIGQNIYQKAHDLYNRKAIEKSLTDSLNRLEINPAVKSNKSRLKLAIVSNSFQINANDIDLVINNQIQKMAELYEVTVFCPRRTNSPGREVVDNVTIFRLFDACNYPAVYPNHETKTFCPELFFLLMRNDFDLILCYPGLNSNNKIAVLAAKIKDIPAILISIGIIDYAARFDAMDLINPEILQTINLRKTDRMFLKNLDYIFTVSEKEYMFLRKLNRRIEQIPVQIQAIENEPEQLSVRESFNIAQDTFIFLCIGDMIYLNGQDIVLKAFTKALPNLPDAKLVLLGNIDTEPEFVEDMEALIGAEALQDVVILLRVNDYNTASTWLKEANISLLPARFKMADTGAAESWIVGVPVLQSDAVDPNLVIDDHNGYLFRSEDIDDLASQMQKALANQAKLRKMAEQGKALVQDKYTLESVINRYAKIFKQLTT